MKGATGKKVNSYQHVLLLIRPILECEGQVLNPHGKLLNVNRNIYKWNNFVLDVKKYFAISKGKRLRYRYSEDKKCIQFWESAR